jgi:hypothetical protein
VTTARRVTTQLLINVYINFEKNGFGLIKVFSVHGAKMFGVGGKDACISGTVSKVLCIYILILL